jgi:hypothetical protein
MLEVDTDAPMEDVRAAHERLSRGIDPASPDCKARLDALDEALATLTDPTKRARYDMGMKAREKPASEHIAAIEPSLSLRGIAVAAVVVLLAGVAYYFYLEKEAREEIERTSAAQAAARAKQAADQAKTDELEAQEYERARRNAEISAADASLRGTEKVRQQDEADKRAQIERDRQKQDAKDREAQAKSPFLGRESLRNPFVDYSAIPNPPPPTPRKRP